MNRNASDQVMDAASATGDETQTVAPECRDVVVPMDSVASNVIVQCLLIAARRGRQILLAHEQAAQRQQDESGSNTEKSLQLNET